MYILELLLEPAFAFALVLVLAFVFFSYGLQKPMQSISFKCFYFL